MNREISIQQLYNNPDYLIIDTRDEIAFNHGNIPGSIQVYYSDVQEYLKKQSEEDETCAKRKIVLYCTKGILTIELAEQLYAEGFHTYSLSGGYIAWLLDNFDHTKEEPDPGQHEIEVSIRKKFNRSLFSKFAKAINTYEMLKPGDKVAVCISGGKDSMIMAKLFQELKRHNKFEFELVFMIMDPGYTQDNLDIVLRNCSKLGIPYTIFQTDIFDTVANIDKSPCYLCARMRRGHLYSKAKELGCNKIALGHHYDDVIETILMGMLYGAQVQTMMPKLHSTNFKGMELIRPMYLIREKDIKHWRDYNKLYFIQCACRFTDTCTIIPSEDSTGHKRMEIKYLIETLKKKNPYVESNIFRSVENVCLDTVISYKSKGAKHHFLDEYDSIDTTEAID